MPGNSAITVPEKERLHSNGTSMERDLRLNSQKFTLKASANMKNKLWPSSLSYLARVRVEFVLDGTARDPRDYRLQRRQCHV